MDEKILPVGGLDQLIGALAKASANFTPIERNKTAQVRSDKGSYSYSYASLDAIIAATKPHLSAEGLVLVQSIVPPEQGKGVGIDTTLWHKSGQSLSFGVVFMPVMGTTPQALGGAITYARRYAMCAALNIAAEDDTDAGDSPTAERSPARAPQQTAPRQPAPPPAPAKSAAPAAAAAPSAASPATQAGEATTMPKRHSDVFRVSEELGMTRDDLYSFVTKRFGKRLTELSSDECAKAIAELRQPK